MAGETQAGAGPTGWFAELPEPLRTAFAQHGVRRVFAQGALVHARGDAADGVYRVVSGGVRVSSLTADGRELVLTHLLPGDVFGEISVFDGQPRTHDAAATEATELSLLDTTRFRSVLAAHPELNDYFMRMLCLKLRGAFEALDGAALESVAVRLARRLWWMTGPGSAGGIAAGDAAAGVEPPRTLLISQGELAAMIGCTRQSVNQELQALARRGVVELQGKRVTVLDRAALLAPGA